MRLLARGDAGDPPIVAGESGVAALAGLMALAEDPALKARAHLDDRAVALVIGSAGATDEETYRRVVGRASADVATLAAR
jgi:diaminopropionate ammonia-lyase